MYCVIGLRRSTLLAGMLVLSGCSIYSTPQGPAPIETRPEPGVVQEDERPPVAPQPPPAAEPNAVAAYAGLLGKARAASARGDYNGALLNAPSASTRTAPRSIWSWPALTTRRARQNRPAQRLPAAHCIAAARVSARRCGPCRASGFRRSPESPQQRAQSAVAD